MIKLLKMEDVDQVVSAAGAVIMLGPDVLTVLNIAALSHWQADKQSPDSQSSCI